MERELRERDEILGLAESSAGIGVWDMDMAAQTVRATPQFFRIIGLEPTDHPVSIDQLRAVRHPEDRDQVVNNFRRVMESGEDQYEAEYRIIRPDGKVRWIFGRGRVYRGSNGHPVRYSGIDIDITDRKRIEEQLALTTKELSHRTKNVLAVVQGMIRQIGKRTRNFDEFEKRLQGCIAALAHSHDLLFATDWQGADLRSLVARQLEPFGGIEDGKFAVSGPALSLGPQATQMIGLALHELATNAVKHGALTEAAGTVAVTWERAGPNMLEFRWREKDGPRVLQPRRKGFGHTVLTRMASSLDGDAVLDFQPDGLRWTLTIGGQHLVAE